MKNILLDITSEQFDYIYKFIKHVKHAFMMLSNDDNLYVNIPGKTKGLEMVNFKNSLFI
jgi:hypothetical protein